MLPGAPVPPRPEAPRSSAATAAALAKSAAPSVGPRQLHRGDFAPTPDADKPAILIRPPPDTRLYRLLEEHCLCSPNPSLCDVISQLEAALRKALDKAEVIAREHPPFLQAIDLPDGASIELAPRSALKMLDVGCVRVDGTDLWPNEEAELDLPPVYAPLGFAEFLVPPVAPGGEAIWGKMHHRMAHSTSFGVKAGMIGLNLLRKSKDPAPPARNETSEHESKP